MHPKAVIGAVAVVAVVALVLVLRGGGEPTPDLVESSMAGFPTRGDWGRDDERVAEALDAWKTADRERDVEVLYAGQAGQREVVMLRQGEAIASLRPGATDTWQVQATAKRTGATEPVPIDGMVLLPEGDWEHLPIDPRDERLEATDGLLSSRRATGRRVDPALIVEADEPQPKQRATVFDTQAGGVGVDARTHRAVLAADPQTLPAIHAALLATRGSDRRGSYASVERLWLGDVVGHRAAILTTTGKRAIGLGLAGFDRPYGIDLGSAASPLASTESRGLVGAAYVSSDGGRALVAAAIGDVERIEVLAGTRRISRPAPIAIVEPSWDRRTEDAVVLGRDAGGRVVAPMVPAG